MCRLGIYTSQRGLAGHDLSEDEMICYGSLPPLRSGCSLLVNLPRDLRYLRIKKKDNIILFLHVLLFGRMVSIAHIGIKLK